MADNQTHTFLLVISYGLGREVLLRTPCSTDTIWFYYLWRITVYWRGHQLARLRRRIASAVTFVQRCICVRGRNAFDTWSILAIMADNLISGNVLYPSQTRMYFLGCSTDKNLLVKFTTSKVRLGTSRETVTNWKAGKLTKVGLAGPVLLLWMVPWTIAAKEMRLAALKWKKYTFFILGCFLLLRNFLGQSCLVNFSASCTYE
jgi:hypothetical protein